MMCHPISEHEFAAHRPDLSPWRHRWTTEIEWYESRDGRAIAMLGRDHTRQLYFWVVLVDDGAGFVVAADESGYSYRHAAGNALLEALDRAITCIERSERATRPMRAVRIDALVAIA